jgi:hypothetical protein
MVSSRIGNPLSQRRHRPPAICDIGRRTGSVGPKPGFAEEVAMRWYAERLVLLSTLCFLAFAVSPEGSGGAAVAVSAAALMIAAAATVRALAVALRAPRVPAAERAFARRNDTEQDPEPQHPSTAGRPRPRAPGRILPVA